MPTRDENHDTKVSRAIDALALNQEQDVRTKIIDTSLYSVFLISSSDSRNESCQVLLVEHTPAKEPVAFVLTLEIKTSATKTEILKKVAAAVETHFIEPNHAVY
ncbi:hypothetical protein [Planococcus sp. 107-1]|uniref:hypothetical protein n=1 Tax=Planococcus sp. 107-1 TaxID=2908840 RepID=UPI001F3575C2|nr:hypothetical protein [Planococcus sp. 107-1]UJF26772.1 hypothetical protein L0M13_16810 [Planococcus sp. 107-1]